MTAIDGFYQVVFNTPNAGGAGVAVLSGGQLRGGDSMVAYVGTYESDGHNLTAEVTVFTHMRTPGMENILGVENATISFSGAKDGDSFHLSGRTAQAPGVVLTLMLHPLPEA